MIQASSDNLTDPLKDIHRDWIQILLKKYYDPMYEYQLGKKQDRIIFRGMHHEFNEWIRD